MTCMKATELAVGHIYIWLWVWSVWLPGWLSVKNLPANAGDTGDPWVRKIPWGREWQPTPIFLPGKSHGQRSLVGYSPWGCRVRHNWVTKHHTAADQSRVQIFLHSYASIFILMNILFLLEGRRLMVQVVGGKVASKVALKKELLSISLDIWLLAPAPS